MFQWVLISVQCLQIIYFDFLLSKLTWYLATCNYMMKFNVLFIIYIYKLLIWRFNDIFLNRFIGHIFFDKVFCNINCGTLVYFNFNLLICVIFILWYTHCLTLLVIGLLLWLDWGQMLSTFINNWLWRASIVDWNLLRLIWWMALNYLIQKLHVFRLMRDNKALLLNWFFFIFN